MKTTGRRRFSAVVAAFVATIGLKSTTTDVTCAEAGNNSAVTVNADTISGKISDSKSDTTSENPHTFMIGNQGYSFTPYTKGGLKVTINNIADYSGMIDYVVINKTEGAVKAFDIEGVANFEAGISPSWSYKQFEYDAVKPNEITADVCNNSLKAIVNSVTLTEEQVSKYDVFKDGKIDVRDTIFMCQIMTANPLSYLGTEFTAGEFVDAIGTLAKTADSIKVSVTDDKLSCEAINQSDDKVLPEEFKTYFEDAASFYGIEHYRVAWSDEVIMYAFGIDIYGVRIGEDYPVYQVLPVSPYYEKLMCRQEWIFKEANPEEKFSYVIWRRCQGMGCVYGHWIKHIAVTKEDGDKELYNWFLIPTDADGNDILEFCAGSSILKKEIERDYLYEPITFEDSTANSISSFNLQGVVLGLQSRVKNFADFVGSN